ncbi:Hypothetical predicted protein [Podarcis lilfordi]|uniref:Uncharacterized protein n=1 Tax=Podarcis lilfordi TaxID=74358 RepID=A0AA35LNP6_9SAUR|nr:Hypothetical predicted protein [Podarcis lilfordi]
MPDWKPGPRTCSRFWRKPDLHRVVPQEPRTQSTPTVDTSGSSNDEEVQVQQETPAAVASILVTSDGQGGKRKARKKHSSKKSK